MRFVSYLRVSTDKQGRSGLGLEAQREAVAEYLTRQPAAVRVAEFVEVESGKRSDRQELAKAMAVCRVHRATLVIAKLDRLARDAHFLLGLQKAGVEFVAADMPDANRMTISIMAVIAEGEAKMISTRTKAALAAAKARGKRLGGWRGGPVPTDADRRKAALAHTARATRRAADLAPVVARLRTEGAGSLGALAAALNREGVPTPRGGTWTATAGRRLVRRIEGETLKQAA